MAVAHPIQSSYQLESGLYSQMAWISRASAICYLIISSWHIALNGSFIRDVCRMHCLTALTFGRIYLREKHLTADHSGNESAWISSSCPNYSMPLQPLNLVLTPTHFLVEDATFTYWVGYESTTKERCSMSKRIRTMYNCSRWKLAPNNSCMHYIVQLP